MARSFRFLMAVLVSAIGATLIAQSTPRTSANTRAQNPATRADDQAAAAPVRQGAPPSERPVPPPPASFTVLHNQLNNPAPVPGGVTSQNFEASLDAFDSFTADDFTIPAGQTWSIQHITVIGEYSTSGPAASANVVFYADSATLPGAIECSRTGTPIQNDTAGTFEILLPTACALGAGTHWMLVQANQDTSAGQWFWDNRLVISGSGAAWKNPGNGFGTGCTTYGRKSTCLPTQNGPDQLFRLAGQLTVPSPCAAFQAKAALPIDAYGAGVATDGIFVYAAGGYSFSAGDSLTTFSRYDPIANSWAALASVPTSVAVASAVYSPINNKFYLFGGASGPSLGTIRNITQVYDIASNTWSTGAAMPAVRSQMASGYHNGKIYIVGGFDTSGVTPQATTWEYDPVANTWNTSRAPIPHALGGPGSGVIAGHLFVAGGRDGGTPALNSLYTYNIAGDSWNQRTDLLSGANVPASAVIHGQLWLAGGGNPFSPVTTATSQFFDPSANIWSSGPSLTVGRSFVSGTAIGGRFFAVGGYNGATTVTTTDLAACGRPFGDVDVDRKTDRTIYRNGVWFTAKTGGGADATGWGTGTDLDVLGDYDGDRKADLAIFRPTSGLWFILQSNSGTVRAEAWGQSGDIPVAGDIDGDGEADLIIFRPSAGAWFVKKSNGGTTVLGWGLSTDYPLVGDYDGDGRADFVAYRPSSGVWYIALSGGGTRFVGWGTPGDIPVVGNFDGDGRDDPTIFRPSTGQWFVNKSSGGTIVVGWGAPGDIPVSGDWDGDGRSDYTIWRDSNGTWFTQYAVGGTAGVAWGVSGDKPSGRRPGT